MLKIESVLNISGESTIDGTKVVYMNATINSNEVGTTISKTIVNKELYNTHKTQVRQDMNDFEDYVYDMETVITENTQATVEEK